MDKREEAAALRESVRVNGKAEAGSDDDSDFEGEKTPPPMKVWCDPFAVRVCCIHSRRYPEGIPVDYTSDVKNVDRKTKGRK